MQKLIEIRLKLKAKYQNIDLAEVTDQEMKDDPELQFLQKLEGVLKDNLSNEDFRIEPHLCRAMLMSRPQLYRKIKALKDMSPSAYLRQYRLQAAHRLLQHTDQKIGDIASQTGFRDPSYFTKVYTATYGATPSETHQSKSAH